MILKYDWHDYPNISMFFMKVYFNTLTYIETHKLDRNYPQEVLSDLEEYLYYFRKHNYDIMMIKEKIDKFLYIGKFTSNNINELFKQGDRVIYLSDSINKSSNLSVSEMRRLHLYLGLNKYLFNFDNDKTHAFSSLYSSLFDDVSRTESLVNNGWLLVQDELTRELAERITYESLGKNKSNNKDIPISNLEKLYPVDDIVVSFGGTISGVGSLYNHDKLDILNDLLKKALNSNFTDCVISEYIYKDNELELYLILYLMGILNEQITLSRENIATIMSNNTIKKIYNKILELTNSLYTLDNDEYVDIPIKEVSRNIFVKERIKRDINIDK